jgi:hypothetical protein
MPKYVIERTLPGAGSLTSEQVEEIAQKSNSVLEDMGGDVQWLESFITTDKLYCVYIAPNPDRIREHARCGGFPCDSVEQVNDVMDPTTADRAGVAA